jgi:hypothetical protein
MLFSIILPHHHRHPCTLIPLSFYPFLILYSKFQRYVNLFSAFPPIFVLYITQFSTKNSIPQRDPHEAFKSLPETPTMTRAGKGQKEV